MSQRNIIVIGASAGGFGAIKKLIGDLPANFNASVFIVWHMAPEGFGIMPEVLNKLNNIPAANAVDKEKIVPGRIYVAPPDRHLIIEDGHIRLTRGPKENRFRPAVDPLFRSAAYEFGPRVIGVVLSGALDDGTAGLWNIKDAGGIAVVQEPTDAEHPSMPQSAMKWVDVDYHVPIKDMASLLVNLSSEEVADENIKTMKRNERTKLEISVALANSGSAGISLFKSGQLSAFTCPECHGVLSSFNEGGRERYRCHTGHAFSTDSLLASLSENSEQSMWNAIRCIQEMVILLNESGEKFKEARQPDVAAVYFRKAQEADAREKMLRQLVFDNEFLDEEILKEEATHSEHSEKGNS